MWMAKLVSQVTLTHDRAELTVLSIYSAVYPILAKDTVYAVLDVTMFLSCLHLLYSMHTIHLLT